MKERKKKLIPSRNRRNSTFFGPHNNLNWLARSVSLGDGPLSIWRNALVGSYCTNIYIWHSFWNIIILVTRIMPNQNDLFDCGCLFDNDHRVLFISSSKKEKNFNIQKQIKIIKTNHFLVNPNQTTIASAQHVRQYRFSTPSTLDCAPCAPHQHTTIATKLMVFDWCWRAEWRRISPAPVYVAKTMPTQPCVFCFRQIIYKIK